MRRPASATRARPRTSELATFPAPTAGWISNKNLSAPSSGAAAFTLRNFFPGTETVKLRRGSEKYATIGEDAPAVPSLLTYALGNNERIFAATADAIYDATVIIDPDVSPDPAVEGLNSGNWSSVQFATDGGTFLICVNGEDAMQIFDGLDWWEITDQPINRLAYDTEFSGFAVGEVVTGGTSGATATVTRVVDNGTAGYLYVGEVTGGPFVDGETLTGDIAGSAAVDGVIFPMFEAITGVDTSDLTAVWAYNDRLFFAQKNELIAWYLPIAQIGGAANPLRLGGVFGQGGELSFGSSWSGSATGQGGLSEQCAFVTTEGEVAIYQGTNPSSASEWAKVGLYKVGRPLGKNAHFRVGGDLITATDIGLIGLSMAMQRDIAALAPSALSFGIDPDWRQEVEARIGLDWHCLVWTEGQMVAVAVPPMVDHSDRWFVANALTGGWSEFTGWKAYSMAVHKNRLFFGSDGRVVEAGITGMDEGQPYSGHVISLFDAINSPASIKVPRLAKATLREPYESAPEVTVQFDFTEALPIPSPSAIVAFGNDGVWGDSDWDDADWSSSSLETFIHGEWVSVGGTGYHMAPSLSVASGLATPLDTELVRWEVMFAVAGVVS